MRRKLKTFFLPHTFWEWVAVFFTVGVSSLGGYWAIVDRNPAALSEAQVLTPQVRPGGEFSIRYHVDWNSTCRVTGYRFIIDSAGQQYTVAPDSRWISPRDEPEFTISIPIPLAAKPGPAIYKAVILYECNPLQKLWPLERPIMDRHFTILPPTWPENTSAEAGMCPSSKPVHVDAHCRGRPAATIRIGN